jgi:vancomycin resistance protein YoaR
VNGPVKAAPVRPTPAPSYAQGGYGYAPQGAAKPHKRQGSGAGRVLFLFIGLAALAFGAFYGKTWLEVKPYDAVFAPNVFVDGIAMEGMTAAQGVAAVRANALGKVNGLQVRLMAGENVYTTITGDMLGLSYNTDAALNEAWAVGHVGTVFDRKTQLENARAAGYQAYSAMPGTDNSPVDALLIQLKNEIYREPEDASFTFNPDASDPFTFVPEVQGRSLDIEPLKQEIYQRISSLQSGDIQIVPTITPPQVTVDMLKQNLTLRFRATTTISAESTENRTNNIRRAFEKISGEILEPGEKFSFNGVVGARTIKNGFKEAPEYAYGELVPGIGGGVCQASTTVYLAALQAGLQILDREPHSGKVNYTDLGRDATVYMNGNRKIDLVFKNNTEGSIYITSAVKSDPSNRKRFICEVSMYGLSLGDVSYELRTQEIRKIPIPAEPEIIKDKDKKFVEFTDQEYKVKGQEGYVVASFLVKKQNGVEVETEQLYEDTYREKADKIYVGVTPRE